MWQKRMSVVVAAIAILLAFSASAMAFGFDLNPRAKMVGNECVLVDNSGLPTNVELILFPEAFLPRSVLRANITVVAKCMTDQTWRDTYSEWSTKISDIVDDADQGLTSNFGITYSPVIMPTVTSTPTDSTDYLVILQKQGLKYTADGTTKTADVAIGFSAVVETNASGDRVAGRSKYEKPYACILDRGSRNAESLQHESGHMYGLARTSNQHCPNDCVMTAKSWGYINKFCDSCKPYWLEHADKY